MPFLSSHERSFLQAVGRLGYSNPFLPERIQYEREALGQEYEEAEPVWSMRVEDPERPHVNIIHLSERVETLVQRMRAALVQGSRPSGPDLELYQDAGLFVLYHRYRDHLYGLLARAADGDTRVGRVSFYSDFNRDWEHLFQITGVTLPRAMEASHLFACFFQVRRAFQHIFSHLVGSSMPAARLRAAVWQSIFTHDMRRYRDALYARMGDITTLVTGPTGTGKELVARAIGLSRYSPFDTKSLSFAQDSFQALNLSALPSTLIESELFGHRRGAFTGALQDRHGWLEVCPPEGTVFLDEIGDLDPSIQVKLLRVIQTRTFQRLGETSERRFRGKMIAATNRNLVEAMRQGRFREDFYYRMCSDVITTPSLCEQLQESPRVLRELLLFIARRVAGPGAEALAEEVEAWIARQVGRDYAWPGNIRELEQCVRSVMIRKEYHPPRDQPGSGLDHLKDAWGRGALTAEEVLQWYCTQVYAQTGSYEETARRLQLDRRTVKSKIDGKLINQFRTADG